VAALREGSGDDPQATRWGPFSEAGCPIAAYIREASLHARAGRITKFQAYLNELIPFIQDIYISDVELLGFLYKDYFSIGRGAVICSPMEYSIRIRWQYQAIQARSRGERSTAVGPVDATRITEQVTYSWYSENTNNLKPSSGLTVPQYPKTGAYSWLKAPGTADIPWKQAHSPDVGQRGLSKRDLGSWIASGPRQEALKIAQAMRIWVGQLTAGGRVYAECSPPAAATSLV